MKLPALSSVRVLASFSSFSQRIAPKFYLPSVPVQIHSRYLHSTSQLKAGKVTVHFLFPNGKKKTVQASQGKNLLDVVLDHDIDIDGFGACEGTLACSTCHLIVSKEVYDQLPPPVDEELDMLDLAYELTDTSRLGCQIVLTKELDGLEVTVPEGLADARS